MATEDQATQISDSYSDLDDSWLQRTRVGKFLSRPCVGSSFAYGAGGYFAVYLATFGWTSSWKKANIYATISLGVVGMTASTVCTFTKIQRDKEFREMKQQREEEKTQRVEAVQKKIEERKRRHAERMKGENKEETT